MPGCSQFSGRYGFLAASREGAGGVAASCNGGADDPASTVYHCQSSGVFSPAPSYETLCRKRKLVPSLALRRRQCVPIGGCPRVTLTYGAVPESQGGFTTVAACVTGADDPASTTFTCGAHGVWSPAPAALTCQKRGLIKRL